MEQNKMTVYQTQFYGLGGSAMVWNFPNISSNLYIFTKEFENDNKSRLCGESLGYGFVPLDTFIYEVKPENECFLECFLVYFVREEYDIYPRSLEFAGNRRENSSEVVHGFKGSEKEVKLHCEKLANTLREEKINRLKKERGDLDATLEFIVK